MPKITAELIDHVSQSQFILYESDHCNQWQISHLHISKIVWTMLVTHYINWMVAFTQNKQNYESLNVYDLQYNFF
jgi:hypothetical protein